MGFSGGGRDLLSCRHLPRRRHLARKRLVRFAYLSKEPVRNAAISGFIASAAESSSAEPAACRAPRLTMQRKPSGLTARGAELVPGPGGDGDQVYAGLPGVPFGRPGNDPGRAGS